MNDSSGSASIRPEGRREDRWRERLSWSMIGAVLLHVALFALSPDWILTDRPEDRSPSPAETAWIAAAPVSAPAAGGGPAGARPAAEGPDSVAEGDRDGEEAGSGAEGSGGEDGETVVASSELWDRVRGTGGPELASAAAPPRRREDPEPEPESSGRERVEAEGRSPAIGGRAGTAAMSDRRGEDGSELGRLTGLDPDVATGFGSSEILLRNPDAVSRFRRTASRQNPAVANTRSFVGVTIWIDETGSVEWAEISEPSGHRTLDEVTLRLFREVVEFRPAVEGGERVPKSMIFYILFPW